MIKNVGKNSPKKVNWVLRLRWVFVRFISASQEQTWKLWWTYSRLRDYRRRICWLPQVDRPELSKVMELSVWNRFQHRGSIQRDTSHCWQKTTPKHLQDGTAYCVCPFGGLRAAKETAGESITCRNSSWRPHFLCRLKGLILFSIVGADIAIFDACFAW